MTVGELLQKFRLQSKLANMHIGSTNPFLKPECTVRHPDGKLIIFANIPVDQLKFIPRLHQQLALNRNVGKISIGELGDILKQYCGDNFGLKYEAVHTHTPTLESLKATKNGYIRGTCKDCGEEVICIGWRSKKDPVQRGIRLAHQQLDDSDDQP